MNITSKQRDQVYARDQWRCVACGQVNALQVHHRKNRGMGGDPKGKLNRLSNLMTLCAMHNSLLESDPMFAEKGRKYGWKLRHQDPTLMPVFYGWAEEWRDLDDFGNALLSDSLEVD